MLAGNFMAPYQKYRVLCAIVLLSAVASVIIYYLAKTNPFSYATGVFWHGAIAGFAGCIFLLSLILTIFLVTTKSLLTKKLGLVFFMFVLSGIITATSYLVKPGDSDVWWYGVIAGFSSSFVSVLLIVTAYIARGLLAVMDK